MVDLFNFPKTIRPMGSIQTSVLVSQEFYQIAKEHNIKFSEALRVGLAIMFAECGIGEYDNKLNLHRKMIFYKEQAEKALQKLSELNIKLE